MVTRCIFLLLSCLIAEMVCSQDLTIYRSSASVQETAERIEALIHERGLRFFETVSHEEIAEERGAKLSPTKVVLFEDPDLTTQLIQCQQTAALDLPLKILVWEEHGDVYLGFVDPRFMKKRFLLTDCEDILESMTRLMLRITNDAIREY